MADAIIIISQQEVPGTSTTNVVVGLPDFRQATVTVPTAILGTPNFDAMVNAMIANMSARVDALSGEE